MQHLEWSDALALELPAMDDTHREFVDLLAAVNTATDDSLLAQWAALIDHTDDHFGREDAWMQATRFASSNCHTMQHKVVLQVLRGGRAAQCPAQGTDPRLRWGDLFRRPRAQRARRSQRDGLSRPAWDWNCRS